MRPLAAPLFSAKSKVPCASLKSKFVHFIKGSPKLVALLLIAASLGAVSPAIAQNAQPPNVPVRSDDGSVSVNGNARDIRTGPLNNTSNIPLPSSLPAGVQEGVGVPVDRTRLAPNTIEIRPDLPYIQENFNRIINGQTPGSDDLQYTFQPETVQLQTTFDLLYRQGDHNFAEGIQVRVLDGTGNEKRSQTIFVRGDGVTLGPNGETLLKQQTIEATYGVNDVVELRVLNLRENNQAPSESAIYFTRDFKSTDLVTGEETVGGFIVEDSQDGGDLDFDDGEYVQAPIGAGNAIAREERGSLTVETRAVPVELDPLIEQVVVEEQELVEGDVQADVTETELAREYGRVEIESFEPSILLGHATGVRAEGGEQLLYNRYSNAKEARLGSDGLSVTGQLSPLIGNPGAPPTLITGNLRFDPFVDDNEAGLVARLGLTQFLTRTHRIAQDEFGNDIVGPDDDRLLEPTGLFSNRRLVGYVPTITKPPVQGEQISSSGGIFELPSDQAVTIDLPDPQRVGRGQAAYTDNVGGVVIERADGSLTFVPQWTKAGYAQSSTSLAAGEATRIIYALVPQQAGQNLQLDQTYAVTQGEAVIRLQTADLRLSPLTASLKTL